MGFFKTSSFILQELNTITSVLENSGAVNLCSMILECSSVSLHTSVRH